MCLQRYPEDIVSASWDSVIFDLKEGPLKKIFMLEPLRGTEAHVRRLFGPVPDRAGPPEEHLEAHHRLAPNPRRTTGLTTIPAGAGRHGPEQSSVV